MNFSKSFKRLNVSVNIGIHYVQKRNLVQPRWLKTARCIRNKMLWYCLVLTCVRSYAKRNNSLFLGNSEIEIRCMSCVTFVSSVTFIMCYLPSLDSCCPHGAAWPLSRSACAKLSPLLTTAQYKNHLTCHIRNTACHLHVFGQPVLPRWWSLRYVWFFTL